MKLARPLLVAPALLAFLGVARVLAGDETGGKDPVTKFVRFEEKDQDEDSQKASLETAYATYRKPGSDVEVILYGAVHMADKAYYKKVQKDLSSYDVVLYEMVTPPKDPAKVDENMKTIGELQGAIGDMLGFQGQKEGIDYKAKNLVHADMTYEELEKAAGGDVGKALPGGDMFDPEMMKQLKPALKMMKGFGKLLQGAGFGDSLKLMLGKQLGNADASQFGGDVQKVIIVERNKVAMKVLEKELEKRTSGKIAIFYGAAHMKDFHERLVAKGFSQKTCRWNVAWAIGGEKDDKDDEEKPARPEPRKSKKHDEEPVPAGTKKRWL